MHKNLSKLRFKTP